MADNSRDREKERIDQLGEEKKSFDLKIENALGWAKFIWEENSALKTAVDKLIDDKRKLIAENISLRGALEGERVRAK